MLADLLRHQEFGILRPAVVGLRQPDLLLVQRLSMGSAGVLIVGRTVGDMAIDNDQRRAVRRVLEGAQGALQHLQVVDVADARDVPAVADEAGGDVLAEGSIGVAFDGDLVVVVEPA